MAMAMALGSADPLAASHAHKFAAILVVPNVLGNVFPEPVTFAKSDRNEASFQLLP